MLEKILYHNPDILIGDFNFTLEDDETKFLIAKKYFPQNTDINNSTPYNRVDHCFIKNKKPNNYKDNILLNHY